MSSKRKQKLIDLGAELLAESLIELAERLDVANDLVERILTTPMENIKRFKTKLSTLKRSTHFVHWRESAGLAGELEVLLQDIKAVVDDPLTGVKLVASFYETDDGTLANCDDSSGNVQEVYCYDAKILFVEYASRCTEKKKIADIIFKLIQKDDYGVRDTLIDCAGEYLPESDIRIMIAKIKKLSEHEPKSYIKSHWLHQIESLARQVKDAKLFEETRIESWGELSTASYIDISRVNLESGDPVTALSWVKKIPENESFQSYERGELLIDIYSRLGDTEKLTETLYRKFRTHRSTETLQELLDVIGNDKHDEIVSEEVVKILAQKDLSLNDSEFLAAMGKIDAAESYLLDRSEQLNGYLYGSLLLLAKTMAAQDRHLVTSIIYRSLLNAILERGYTKAYPHGVMYLIKLDKLAVLIHDWIHFDNHEIYTKQIHEAHGRKRSFWAQYAERNE